MNGHNPHPAGVPTLCLGMVGFSPDQRAAMAALVTRRRPGQPAWRVGRFWEADAWWVNGSHIVVLPDGNLHRLTPQAACVAAASGAGTSAGAAAGTGTA